jgi:YidC/Oxa1 family membrane protein insertase
MTSLFHTLISKPLYNGLIFLIDHIPHADAGVAVVLFTIIIKFILFPLSRKSIVTQVQMKRMEPEMNAIKEKYKNDRQAQALHTMALYKEKGINPFSGILLIIIQLPILLALYSIFLKSGLPVVNTDMLYSFIAVPTVSMEFLGIINVAEKSLILALIAAIAQYVQLRYALPPVPPRPKDAKPDFKNDLARNMNWQMKYFLPVLIFYISYKFAGVVALYLIVSSLFTLGQELYVRRKIERDSPSLQAQPVK